ncbi:MAG: hypothetical protein HOD92_23210 [Deltaproteobacteria bacterium]|jgi:hypothetical protein|nr:hypothetical protein [Deltaproteobacteria bacterium]MBT4527166.1 hypothetical protein [Deltaproteobacteria bacterium]
MKTKKNQNEILEQATSIKDFVQISKKARLYRFVHQVCNNPVALLFKRSRREKIVKPFHLTYIKH